MRTDQTETRGPDRNGTGRKNATETGAMQPWNFAAGEWSDMGRSIMRMNIEAATLASRRTKAYLELPGQLAACRQPQDIMALQMSFWQTCMRQYAAHGLLRAWHSRHHRPRRKFERSGIGSSEVHGDGARRA